MNNSFFYKNYIKNQNVFFCRADINYSRNQIILNLIKGLNLKKIKILPYGNKRKFFNAFFNRKRIINDFFISIYDSKFIDQRAYYNTNIKNKFILFFYDYINFKFSRYLLADTKEHFKYWEELFGKTKADVLVLPVLANNNIYFPEPGRRKVNKVGELKLLFYGSYIPLQGIDKIIKAINLIKHLNIKVKLIGNGLEFKKIIDLIKELNLSDIITVNGERVLEQDIAKEINDSDVIFGIFGNSRKAKSVVPNKVYQGLACKKCILTMESLAIREFFDENSMYLVKNNIVSIKNAIQDLYENREKIKIYEENGYKQYNLLYNKTKIKFRRYIKQIEEKLKNGV